MTVNDTQRQCDKETGACFMAGTLVHTDTGLTPIEQIKVGDRVLSQPEMKGKLSYEVVTDVFVHEGKETWVIDYHPLSAVDFDEFGEICLEAFWAGKSWRDMKHLVATGDHYFWVRDAGWKAVECLSPRNGDTVLELKDGAFALVIDLRRVLITNESNLGWAADYGDDIGLLIDFQGESIHYIEDLVMNEHLLHYKYGDDITYKSTVYNISVDGSHTYYVGTEGVWVHDNHYVDSNEPSQNKA